MYKNFFGESLKDTKAINIILKAGEDLEKKGDLVDASFLYRGLVAVYPNCKACLSHMGRVDADLEDRGISIDVNQNQVIQEKSTFN